MSKNLAYYNEFDKGAANWIRELIRENLIAPGEVDERSIEDVKPADLVGFTQCHFFAGIGGWSLALRLAGWPDDKPVWTGSCPCQPFSTAGKGAGFADERHLWPSFHWLIKQCQPQTVFGEQVASKDGIAWLDTVSTDLEGENYAIGPIVLPACGFGAPHIRQRTWFVANSNSGREQLKPEIGRVSIADKVGSPSGMAYTGGNGREQARECFTPSGLHGFERDSSAFGLDDSSGSRTRRNTGTVSCPETESKDERQRNGNQSDSPIITGTTCKLGDSDISRLERFWMRYKTAGGGGG